MTIREWIEVNVDIVAPREQLEAFETGFLEGCWRAESDGMRATPDADLDPMVWRAVFDFWFGVRI